MKLYWIVLTFGLTSLFLVTTGIRLIENGYEQLNIVIQENVPENKSERLLARIEEIFRNASELLYKATHRRAYFKDVRVIIPKTWTKKDSYTIVSGISSSTSHIKVGNRRMALPFTVGSAKCGQEGMYIYLPYDQFILQENTTKWGKHDSVIIHEWGHLRWGLKDEYATIRKTETENPNTESGYSQVNRLPTNTINSDAIGGTWKHVSCHSGMDGYFAKDCSTGPDHFSCNAELPEIDDNCKFCPHMIQSVNSSLMGYQYIPSIVEFCDKNDSAIPEYMHHNSKATNEQNIYCEYKSAWEIMREHEDFKNGANPHLPDEQPPSTLFYFAQEISNKVIVLILDTSGSMAGPRIENLYLASKYLIEWALPNGSWVRLISFNTNASFLSEFIQITNETKQSLISRLPKFAEGFTCIPCGLDLALWALNHFQELGSTEGTEVILISDGFNNRGNLEIATQGCINKGVVVTCIAATEGADERLDIIRQETGGRYLYHSDLSSSSLATLFLEIVSGGLSADSSAETWKFKKKSADIVDPDQTPQNSRPIDLGLHSWFAVKHYEKIANYQLNATEDVSQNIIFNIDEGIGKDITVTILAKNTTNIDIRLSGPNNFTQTKSANGTDSLSLVVQGIGMQGQYTAEVTASSVSNIEAIITSRPTSIDVEVVRTTCRLSTNASDFNTSSHPIMYVYVRKGESPVRKAIVEGKIEDPDGKITCNISLFDDGNDPDMKPDDGIYSAVIHKGCQGKNGRHSSKVWIKGTAETVVTHYRSSGSAMIDPDANVAEDTPTGSFERVAFADAFTVINYDINITTKDTTPPGRITNIRLIDIQTDIPGTGLTRQYTIVWTATGDDFNNGQATAYDMRISNDQSLLRRDFLSAERLNVSGVDMAPNVSGKVERLQMTVSSNDAFTSTTYFAIVAIDEAGNRGKVSNIIPITVGLTSQIKAVEEECTDNCYAVVKDCGTNFKISNGRINFTNVVTKAGNFVPVVCDIGYELKGGESIKCLENGTWNGTVTCEIVGCGGVLIANGEVSFSNGTDYDATATVKCSDGYHLIGGNTARCMANGIWNKSSTCEINDCGRNVTIPHGQVGVDLTKARTTYGQSFPVICDTGYKLWGGVSIYCRADGRWSKTVTCKLIDCGATSVVNGQVDHSAGTHFNSTAKILCNSGYAKNGPGIITCLLSEKWSTDSNCTIKDCGTNVTILNGHVNLTDAVTTYGQSVPVNCDTGYELMGGTSIKCDANGRWEATTTCKIKDCGSISIANGEIDLSAGTKYNAVGTIQCDDGYWINGSSKVICLASGIWNSNTDCIRKDCGNYVSIPNGVVDFTNASTTVGHSVPITCETGYKLKGGTSVECGVDGQWSTIATCELIDCQPIRIANGEVQHTSDTKYNATASVNCHAGYQVQGSGILVCLHSGRWSNETKCIVKDCGRSERIANGQVDFNNKNTTYGTFAPVTCDLGYKLKGGSHIKCLADGTWSKRVSCEKVDCGKILIPNGIVSPFEGTKFNATAKVTCDLGFRTIDSDYVVCLHTGLWSKESPCTTVDCGSNINITNGRVNFTPGPTSYGHSANVICNTGFKLKGSAEVVCLAEGLWSTSPTCEIIDCDNNVSVSNGRPVFSGGRTTYGHFAEIICDKGYKLKGTGNISCLEDGTWSALPVCEIIDCGSNVSIVNGEVNFTGARTTYRHSIQVICETGYTIKGPINITCSANGRWSKLPVCERIDCGNSVNIINGQANFTNRNTTYGQIVPVFCYTGYELTAEAHITCLADGFWSKGPACDAIDVTPKSDARVNSTNIVVITASCFGLVALVIIGLLILTVIRTKQNRLLRKRHTREIPPDYSVDESTDERTFSTNKNEGWCIYNARGIQYINPNWNWRSRPANSENTQWPSYY